MLGSELNLITTIIGFGMSTTFIAFVCTRLICGRLRRMEAQAQQMMGMDSRIDLELQQEHQVTGLEPILINAIPTMEFNREAFSSIEDAQCTICLTEYQEREVLRMMPNCGHSFHLSCIDAWLQKQSTCPICRLSVHKPVESKPAPTLTLSTPQTLDGSEITDEHSQQWLLHMAAAHSQGNGHEQMQLDWEASRHGTTSRS